MFAKRIGRLRTSGIRAIFDRAAGMTDCVNLSIGQADYDVPEMVKGAAIGAIERGNNRYTSTSGIPELRAGIAERLRRTRGFEPEEVMVSAGVTGGLALACLCLVEVGDEVLLPDPYFVVYRSLIEFCVGTPVFYNTYPDFRLRREEIESKITDKTKFLVVNSPQNPTGAVYTEEEIRMVADVAAKHDLLVLSDEIYEDFVYDRPFVSISSFYEKTLVYSGFSKGLAVPGWRVSYSAGPKQIIDKMSTLQQFTFVCAPAPFQHACAEGMNLDISNHIADYRRKRELIVGGLKDSFKLVEAHGSFYLFAEAPHGMTGTQFVEAAIERKVLLVPGIAFSTRDTHFRLSFAASDEDLKRGIDILNGLARDLG